MFKYLNIISQNQLGTLIVMTIDGAGCALTTLFFEIGASEIYNVSLSSASVQGLFQPEGDNDVPGWHRYREAQQSYRSSDTSPIGRL